MALASPPLRPAGALTAPGALDRYLERRGKSEPSCSDQNFAVQIDASLPALKKRGSVFGFERIVEQGRTVYHGLQFTGDKMIRTQVIARFLAHQSNPVKAGDVAVTKTNYTFRFDKEADYNGLVAYVFCCGHAGSAQGSFGESCG